ncbi:hypothetical protein E2C01_048983 [Portunus trituberculatus]|uniref:Uncharacterized protein n=1 Tax=Portunus trituberculatus TaxID=210409 RepID=A0A5B7G523_PORTR|nr:hypothetical protein [Portunus trituberculatus]
MMRKTIVRGTPGRREGGRKNRNRFIMLPGSPRIWTHFLHQATHFVSPAGFRGASGHEVKLLQGSGGWVAKLLHADDISITVNADDE